MHTVIEAMPYSSTQPYVDKSTKINNEQILKDNNTLISLRALSASLSETVDKIQEELKNPNNPVPQEFLSGMLPRSQYSENISHMTTVMNSMPHSHKSKVFSIFAALAPKIITKMDYYTASRSKDQSVRRMFVHRVVIPALHWAIKEAETHIRELIEKR